MATALAGPTVATSTPATTGPTISAPAETLDSMPLAAGRRPGPTSAGTAPNTAASENTNTVADSRATTYTWATVSTPSRWATGIVNTSAPSARLPPMISRRRSPRSATGPAISPNSRYGTTRRANRMPVCAADPVSAYTISGRTTVVIAVPTIDTPSAVTQRTNIGSVRSDTDVIAQRLAHRGPAVAAGDPGDVPSVRRGARRGRGRRSCRRRSAPRSRRPRRASPRSGRSGRGCPRGAGSPTRT